MRIIADTKESDSTIKERAHDHKHLNFEGTRESYDIEVQCDDGAVYRGERKRWDDFMRSWMEGKLERQLTKTDFLVVEFSDFMVASQVLEHGEEKASHVHVNALKHLATISANMWVFFSDGPDHTMDIVEYIGRRGRDLKVRPNRVRYRNNTVRETVLAALPGVNPKRTLPDGRTIGEVLDEIVDWEGVVKALNLNEWLGVHQFGITRVRNVADGLLEREK